MFCRTFRQKSGSRLRLQVQQLCVALKPTLYYNGYITNVNLCVVLLITYIYDSDISVIKAQSTTL